MRQGIQSQLNHPGINGGGCYFLCLVEWASSLAGKDYDEDGIIMLWEEFCFQGWLEDDGFVVNPIAMMNYILNDKRYTEVYKSSRPVYRDDFVIVYLKKTGYGHFVLDRINSRTQELIRWDPEDPARFAATQYTVDSYRCFA